MSAIYTKIRNILKNKGIRGLVQRVGQKILGISNYKEEIDTLYYYLNRYVDITALPKTDNEGLRNLQTCDVALLKVFDKICFKYNLTYWLDYGTLLGAIRHKGFIPWDDDTDVAMMRADYNKFMHIAERELVPYGISVKEEHGRIGVGFMHDKTGIWLDIFPVDTLYTNKTIGNVKLELDKLYDKYLKYYTRKLINENKHNVTQIKNDIYKDYQEGDNVIYISCPEFPGSWQGISHNEIFPLKKMQFENYEFNVPNEYKLYLKELYGENYMSFPRTGIERHGESTGRLPLGKWAQMHNVDMNEIYDILNKIFTQI